MSVVTILARVTKPSDFVREAWQFLRRVRSGEIWQMPTRDRRTELVRFTVSFLTMETEALDSEPHMTRLFDYVMDAYEAGAPSRMRAAREATEVTTAPLFH